MTKISTYPGSAASKQPYVSTLFSDASPMWSLWYLWHLECPLKNNDSSQPFEATGEWFQVLFLFVANPLFDSNSFNSSFSFFAPALFCFGANKWLIYLADSHTCVSIRFPICWQLRSKLETICKTDIKRTFCQHRATVWSTRPKKQSEAAKIKHLSLKDLNGGCILAGGSDSPMRGWRFTGFKHFDTMYSVGPSFLFKIYSYSTIQCWLINNNYIYIYISWTFQILKKISELRSWLCFGRKRWIMDANAEIYWIYWKWAIWTHRRPKKRQALPEKKQMYVQPCTTYIRDMHQKAVFWVSGTSYHFSFTTLVLVEILDNLNCQLDARVPFRDGQHKFNNHPNAVSSRGWFFWFLMIRKWRVFFPTLLYTIKNHKEPWCHMKKMVSVDLWCLKMSRSTLWDWWIGRSSVLLPSRRFYHASIFCPRLSAVASAPVRSSAANLLMDMVAKDDVLLRCFFLFFLSCFVGPSWTIMDLIVQNDNWISKWLLSIPIGSMVLVYMLTWLGYIDGKCYHILHTWILWDTLLFIVPLLQVHWSTFFHHVGHLRSSASRLL